MLGLKSSLYFCFLTGITVYTLLNFPLHWFPQNKSESFLTLHIMALSYKTEITQKMVKPAEHKFPLIFSSLFLVGIWSVFLFLCLQQYFRQSHVVLKSLWTSCKYLRGQFLKGKLLNKVSFYQSIKLLINEECLSSEELQRVFWWRWAFFLSRSCPCLRMGAGRPDQACCQRRISRRRWARFQCRCSFRACCLITS